MRGYYPGETERRNPGPEKPARPGTERPPATRRGRRIDWAIGISLGIVVGIAIVAAFLYFGSEETIDAPSISGSKAGASAREAPPVTAPRSKPGG